MEMDEYTFMMNREQAIDYLNTLDKVKLKAGHSHDTRRNSTDKGTRILQ